MPALGQTPDAIAAGLEHLPAWLPWAPAVLYPVAAGLLCAAWGWLAYWITLRPALRLPAGAHWTEHARLRFPARVTGPALFLLFPAIVGLAARLFSGERWALGWGALAALGVAATLPATVGLTLRLRRRLQAPPHRLGPWLRESLSVWLIMYPHLLVAVALGPLAGGQWNTRAWLVGVLACLVAGAALLGWGLHAARALGALQDPPERLRRVLQAATTASGVSAPRIDVVRWSAANAFAFAAPRRLAVTEGALQHLSDEELVAICHHELAHLTEARWVAAVRALGPVALSAGIVLLYPLGSTWGVWGVAGGVVGTLLLLRVPRVVLRRQEARADAAGAHHEGGPGTYARALERIYQINQMPAVLSGRGRIHPHLYDRLLASGVQPDYPRPAPPPRGRQRLALMVACLGLLISLGALWFVVQVLMALANL